MNKVLKLTIILVIILITCTANFCYATSIIDNPDGYKPDDMDVSGIKSKAKIVVTIIRNIGIVVSVIALMAIGLKTMFASVEEKSVYKQALPGYILGVILVVAITVLPSIIYDVTKSIENEQTTQVQQTTTQEIDSYNPNKKHLIN